MPEPRLIQIVPHRGVAAEGVGDYARLIAERMLAAHGVRTVFVACTPLPPEARLCDNWETIELPRRTTRDLVTALDRIGSAPVLLQLSGYGFHAKALTYWVDRALGRWLGPERPLATVFHELYATGPIWSSPFWLGWLQLAGSEGFLHFYRETNLGSATGVFANRNHHAVLLACALPLASIPVDARDAYDASGVVLDR